MCAFAVGGECVDEVPAKVHVVLLYDLHHVTDFGDAMVMRVLDEAELYTVCYYNMCTTTKH